MKINKKINSLEKKGLLEKEEYSIYNPLNYPIGNDKKLLFKKINKTIENLFEKIKEK